MNSFKDNKISLIGVDNKKIQLTINAGTYSIPKSEIEKRFEIYWFSANLFGKIEQKIRRLSDLEWLEKYKR